ncbi:spermidine/putrescine ABC transporter permease, partial [Rhizobium sp. Pop5]
MNAFRRHTGTFALILPLTLFLGVFFI